MDVVNDGGDNDGDDRDDDWEWWSITDVTDVVNDGGDNDRDDGDDLNDYEHWWLIMVNVCVLIWRLECEWVDGVDKLDAFGYWVE